MHNEVDYDGNVYSTQAKAASSSSFEPVLSVQCLAALDLGAGVEQSIDCLIIQSRQSVQSMGRSMDWILKDNVVNGLISFATHTSLRSNHTLFVQTGAETSDINAEAVEPGPRCSWKGYSRGIGANIWDESTESTI